MITLFSVDRIENDIIILYDNKKNEIAIRKDKIPFNVFEGDILSIKNGVYIKEDSLKASIQASNKKLLNSLWEK